MNKEHYIPDTPEIKYIAEFFMKYINPKFFEENITQQNNKTYNYIKLNMMSILDIENLENNYMRMFNGHLRFLVGYLLLILTSEKKEILEIQKIDDPISIKKYTSCISINGKRKLIFPYTKSIIYHYTPYECLQFNIDNKIDNFINPKYKAINTNNNVEIVKEYSVERIKPNFKYNMIIMERYNKLIDRSLYLQEELEKDIKIIEIKYKDHPNINFHNIMEHIDKYYYINSMFEIITKNYSLIGKLS